MPTRLKIKYDSIYNYERFVGNAAALRVIESKPIGVWDFLIPVVFILHFMRNKQSRETFIQNYLFTKRHALDAGYKMLKKGFSREDVKAQFKEKTRALLTAHETRRIYSDTIRQQQIKEVDLLIEHYGRLLNAEGDDYDNLARDAYGNLQNYLIFHERLKSIEKKVSDAARQTLGLKANVETLLKIEKVTEEIRQSQIAKIFGI